MKDRAVPRVLTWSMLVTGAIALWGLDQRVFGVGAVFKVVTTLCLFPILGPLRTAMHRKVAVGLVFSVLGDAALLRSEPLWFKVGLGAFLVTHLCYIAALQPVAVRGLRPIVTACLVMVATLCTLVLAYPRASAAGVALPVAVYASVLSATLVTASATAGGPMSKPGWVALGALLFYLADMSIAIKTFVPSFALPHPVLFTTGLYWIGQYLIVAAVRAGLKRR